jgi:hypothetical protein
MSPLRRRMIEDMQIRNLTGSRPRCWWRPWLLILLDHRGCGAEPIRSEWIASSSPACERDYRWHMPS